MTVRRRHSKWRHFENVVKNVMTSSKNRAQKPLLFFIFEKIYEFSIQQGVNQLFTLSRNKNIVILKMSDFFDVILEIWRHGVATSIFLTNSETFQMDTLSCQVSSF